MPANFLRCRLFFDLALAAREGKFRTATTSKSSFSLLLLLPVLLESMSTFQWTCLDVNVFFAAAGAAWAPVVSRCFLFFFVIEVFVTLAWLDVFAFVSFFVSPWC